MLGICSSSVAGSYISHCSCFYGSETMIWREKDRSKIRAVQMDNLRGLLGIRRTDKVPNAPIKELGGMAKGLRKVFSDGSVMWRVWRMAGVLRGHI